MQKKRIKNKANSLKWSQVLRAVSLLHKKQKSKINSNVLSIVEPYYNQYMLDNENKKYNLSMIASHIWNKHIAYIYIDYEF